MNNKVETLRVVKPQTKPEKATQTTVDTIEVTPALVKTWKAPPFQRPVKMNEKVILLAESMKTERVFPGMLTLGRLHGETWLVDGQHRSRAFELAEIPSAYADVRIGHFESMADMAEEFVRLNSSLVRLRPDDILRGLEPGNEALQKIRAKAPFVGYDMIRRNERAPMLSMSALLRCWVASGHDVPSAAGMSAVMTVKEMTVESTDQLLTFLEIAPAAWGRDSEYAKLWGSLNLALTMWLFRRMVLTNAGVKTKQLTKDQFRKCMMGLSADESYLEWLFGRQLREIDRSPAYNRMKSIMVRRLEQEMGKKPFFPQPPWAASRGRGKR